MPRRPVDDDDILETPQAPDGMQNRVVRPRRQSRGSADRERVPLPKNIKNVRYRLDRVAAWGWAFDIFTVVISIVDVASDVLVAVQFIDDGHVAWFWMVIASMFVSNCIYAVLATSQLVNKRWKLWPSSKPRQFMLAFVIAQAYPLLQWYYETRDAHKGKSFRDIWESLWQPIDAKGCLLQRIENPLKKLRNAGYGEAADRIEEESRSDRASSDEDDEDAPFFKVREDSWTVDTGVASAQEDIKADAESRSLVRRLAQSWDAHLKANVGFYVETAVEAIPQSLIQLLAVSALGEATGIQVLSMCLSLISIVSKTYVVSASYDLRAMLFKASLVTFDIVTLFYVFSTLIARDEPQETTLYTLIPSILGITGSSNGTVFESANYTAWINGTVDALGSPPPLVSTEWLPMVAVWVPLRVSRLAALWIRAASVVTWTGLVAVTVVLTGISLQAGRWEMRHIFIIAMVYIGYSVAAIGITGIKLSLVVLLLINVRPKAKTAAPFYAIANSFYWRGVNQGHAEGESRLKHVLHFSVDHCMKLISSSPQSAAVRGRVMPDAMAITSALHEYIDRQSTLRVVKYKRPAIEGVQFKDKRTWKAMLFGPNPSRRKMLMEGTCVLVLAVWTATAVGLAAISIAFPALHVAWYGVERLNGLQWCCLGLAAVALLIAAWLTPFVLSMVKFTYFVREAVALFSDASALTSQRVTEPATAQTAAACIKQYVLPPHVAVLKEGVRASVLPHDVVEVVAEFLDPEDIDMRHLPAHICAQLRDRTKSSME